MASFTLHQTSEFSTQLAQLKSSPALLKQYKAVSKCIRFLAENPKHPSLNTHKYSSLTGANGEEVFEAYAQNKTPGAYRVFWHYGPSKREITLIAVTAHP
jgi:hypothetical protein